MWVLAAVLRNSQPALRAALVKVPQCEHFAIKQLAKKALLLKQITINKE